MRLRPYTAQDCAEIIRLFQNTVHTVNRADYNEEQLNAWADGQVNSEVWNRSFLEHCTLVAVEQAEPVDGGGPKEIIVGFGDIVPETGYLDRLYVHHAYQRRGIASALCDALEAAASGQNITVHASITAKPFFLARGYEVVRQQKVKRKDVELTNFVMKKWLVRNV